MATKYNLFSSKDMVAFRVECEVLENVTLVPYPSITAIPFDAIVLSSYMLRVVGLWFPILHCHCQILHL